MGEPRINPADVADIEEEDEGQLCFPVFLQSGS